MTLTAGTRLGPYEIRSPLGAGGMGEVYRARDGKLNRDVAIKVLPETLAEDAGRLARFQREAQVLAALNHPHIAAIYGLEKFGNTEALVLELVEGETLGERIAAGPIPVDEALAIARQIAEALEAAHEKGIVHRDLKPANVKITPEGNVKVLDFGLAKALAGDSSSPDVTHSPTLTAAATRSGVVIGTAAYMSPEQARGKAVDKRADVWSFGAVLYEMLTGERAFRGDTISDTLAAVLTRDPDWSALPASTPSSIRRLLRLCLEREPKKRLRDIADAWLESGEAIESAATPVTQSSWRRLIAAALVAAAATALLVLWSRPARPRPPLRKLVLPVDQLASLLQAISPDGTRIAYSAAGRLWIRDLDQFQPREVAGSAEGEIPFWSPDGRQLGFIAKKQLWRYTVGASQSIAIGPVPGSSVILGASWGPDDRIVMAVWRGGLFEISAGGGEPKLLLAPDANQVDFHGPSLLPGGKTLLFVIHNRNGANAVALMDGSTHRLKRVMERRWLDSVTHSPTGHLLLTYGLGKSGIWGVPFSESRQEVDGQEFLVVAGGQYPSVSADGTLVYGLDAFALASQLVWVGRDGRIEAGVGEPMPGLSSPAISPDHRRVVFLSSEGGSLNLWLQDLERGTRTRLTSDSVPKGPPAWSPEGDLIYFNELHDFVNFDIVAVASDGSGRREKIGAGTLPRLSPQAQLVVSAADLGDGRSALSIIPLSGDRKATVLASPSNRMEPAFSPDGHALAYTATEVGEEPHVFLERFPGGAERMQVSLSVGAHPFWSPKGDEIYFLSGDDLMGASVHTAASLSVDTPRKIFSGKAAGIEAGSLYYMGPGMDVSADAQRFLAVRRTGVDAISSLRIVENWFGEFREQAKR
jgi:serine/threonine protein kinase/Tol biopolymer transport system component